LIKLRSASAPFGSGIPALRFRRAARPKRYTGGRLCRQRNPHRYSGMVSARPARDLQAPQGAGAGGPDFARPRVFGPRSPFLGAFAKPQLLQRWLVGPAWEKLSERRRKTKNAAG